MRWSPCTFNTFKTSQQGNVRKKEAKTMAVTGELEELMTWTCQVAGGSASLQLRVSHQTLACRGLYRSLHLF